jgi:hypothetical protein
MVEGAVARTEPRRTPNRLEDVDASPFDGLLERYPSGHEGCYGACQRAPRSVRGRRLDSLRLEAVLALRGDQKVGESISLDVCPFDQNRFGTEPKQALGSASLAIEGRDLHLGKSSGFGGIRGQ